ncbi:MAG: hypothetical protein U9Q74_15500 [Gemmatimonadota bacterium]|nr:hypothetical protein [Gemmatimonadota bacterium]
MTARRRARTVEPPAGAERPAVYSTARLGTLVCPVFVPVGAVEAALRRASPSLAPARLAGVPRGKHPVIVEVWRVQDGVPWFGAMNAHDWSAAAGAVVGAGVFAGVGAVVGAGLGAFRALGAAETAVGPAGSARDASRGRGRRIAGRLVDGIADSLTGIADGAGIGARGGWALGGRAARRQSEWRSRVIGTYNEIIITVPCAARRGATERRFSYVLATCTDSPASMLGERAVGWGYRKVEARGSRMPDGTLQVTVAAADRPLRLRPGNAGAVVEWSPAVAARATLASLEAPLLGTLADGRLRISYFDRAHGAAGATLRGVDVAIESLDALVPGAGAGAVRVPAFGSRAPWGAVYAEDVPVALTHPRAPRDADAL